MNSAAVAKVLTAMPFDSMSQRQSVRIDSSSSTTYAMGGCPDGSRCKPSTDAATFRARRSVGRAPLRPELVVGRDTSLDSARLLERDHQHALVEFVQRVRIDAV